MLALMLAGCAVTAGQDDSLPLAPRFTDEAIRQDWAEVAAVRARLAALAARGMRGYLIERATAEVDLAVEQYEENDRTGIAAALFADAQRLVVQLETGAAIAAPDLSLPKLPALADLAPALWTQIADFKSRPAILDCAGEALARTEISLIQLAHEKYEADAGWHDEEYVQRQQARVDEWAARLQAAAQACMSRPAPA